MKRQSKSRANRLSIPLAIVISMIQTGESAASNRPMFHEIKTFMTGPNELFVKNNICYFSAAGRPATDVELWMSDGMDCKKLSDIRKGDEGSFPTGFSWAPLDASKGYLHFAADDGQTGRRAWRFTPETRELERLGTGTNPLFITPFTIVTAPPLSYGGFICSADNQLVIVSPDGIAKIGSARRSAVQVRRPRNITAGWRYYPGDPRFKGERIFWVLPIWGMDNEALGGKGRHTAFFFSAEDKDKGREFYRYTRQSAVTPNIVPTLEQSYDPWLHYEISHVDINPGPGSSNPSNFTSSGKNMFFSATNGKDGKELWVDTNYKGKVFMVKDINPGSSGSTPGDLTPANDGSVFFTAFTLEHGRELWKSNGTQAGTRLIKDIIPGDNSAMPNSLCMVGETLFFTADNGVHGNELWKSDGTEEGTVMVRDIRHGKAGSKPADLTAMDGKLYFTCDSDGDGQRELWVSNGTRNGTNPLLSNFPEKPDPGRLAAGESLLFLTVGNALYSYDPNGVMPPAAPTGMNVKRGLNDLVFEYKMNGPDGASEVLYFSRGTNPPSLVASRPSQAPSGLNSYQKVDLLPNTPYSFSVRSQIPISNISLWTETPYITAWTLAPKPERVGAVGLSERTWTNHPSMKFMYYGMGIITSGIIGEGGISSFRYAFNTASSHTFDGTEGFWVDPISELEVSIPVSGVYYLHLQSLNMEGIANPESVTLGPWWFDFIPPNAPSRPVGSLEDTTTVRFVWQETTDSGGSGVASYHCEIGTNPSGNILFSDHVGLTPSHSYVGERGSTYYCRVRAIDAAGNEGPWSVISLEVTIPD